MLQPQKPQQYLSVLGHSTNPRGRIKADAYGTQGTHRYAAPSLLRSLTPLLSARTRTAAAGSFPSRATSTHPPPSRHTKRSSQLGAPPGGAGRAPPAEAEARPSRQPAPRHAGPRCARPYPQPSARRPRAHPPLRRPPSAPLTPSRRHGHILSRALRPRPPSGARPGRRPAGGEGGVRARVKAARQPYAWGGRGRRVPGWCSSAPPAPPRGCPSTEARAEWRRGGNGGWAFKELFGLFSGLRSGITSVPFKNRIRIFYLLLQYT